MLHLVALLPLLTGPVAGAPTPVAPRASAAELGDSQLDPRAARIRLLRGRAELLSHTGNETLTQRRGRAEVHGAGIVKLAAGSRLEIAWPGVASIRVQGPAELEWRPPWDGSWKLALRVLHVSRLQAEIRRGAMQVELPTGGWTIQAPTGAFALSGLPGGAVRLEPIAGGEIEATSQVPRNGAVPRVRARAGSRVRLAGMSAVP